MAASTFLRATGSGGEATPASFKIASSSGVSSRGSFGERRSSRWDGSEAFQLSAEKATKTAPQRPPEQDKRLATIGEASYRVFDRSSEVGKRTLSPEEESEIRGELKQLEKDVKAGKTKVRVIRP